MTEKKDAWKDYYKTARDWMTENIGRAGASEQRSTYVEWDVQILKSVRDILDIVDAIKTDLGYASTIFEELFSRMEKLEKQTGTFDRQLEKYKPLLGHLERFLEEKKLEEQELEKLR